MFFNHMNGVCFANPHVWRSTLDRIFHAVKYGYVRDRKPSISSTAISHIRSLGMWCTSGWCSAHVRTTRGWIIGAYWSRNRLAMTGRQRRAKRLIMAGPASYRPPSGPISFLFSLHKKFLSDDSTNSRWRRPCFCFGKKWSKIIWNLQPNIWEIDDIAQCLSNNCITWWLQIFTGVQRVQGVEHWNHFTPLWFKSNI